MQFYHKFAGIHGFLCPTFLPIPIFTQTMARHAEPVGIMAHPGNA